MRQQNSAARGTAGTLDALIVRYTRIYHYLVLIREVKYFPGIWVYVTLWCPLCLLAQIATSFE
jgi:uncharacterized protein (DUF983 family)